MNKKNNIRDIDILLKNDNLFEPSQQKTEAKTCYELLFKATREGVWEYNIDTQKAVYNEGIFELFGYSLNEMTDNRSWWQNNIHPGEKQRIISGLHNLMGCLKRSGGDDTCSAVRTENINRFLTGFILFATNRVKQNGLSVPCRIFQN